MIEETDYNTVLDRIFIRAEIKGKWKTISLKEAMPYTDQIDNWLKAYTDGHYTNKTPEQPYQEIELIEIVKWLDRFRPPARLKKI